MHAVDQAQQSGKLLLGQVRKHGFERPFARDQVISWTGHSISAVCFYVAAISLLIQGETDDTRGVISLVRLPVCLPGGRVAQVCALVLTASVWS